MTDERDYDSEVKNSDMVEEYKKTEAEEQQTAYDREVKAWDDIIEAYEEDRYM